MDADLQAKLELIKRAQSQGMLGEALRGFMGTRLEDEARVLQGKLNTILKSKNDGVFLPNEFVVEHNKVSVGVRELINRLEFGDEKVIPQNKETRASKGSNWIWGIAILPAVYLLGFLIWGLNSWNYHLGAMPAFHLQYLVAGIIPFLILVGGGYGGKFLKRLLLTNWPTWINSTARGALFLKLIFRLVFWSSILFLLLDSFFSFPESWKETAIFSFVGVCSFGDEKIGMGLGKFFRSIWIHYGIFAAIILGLVFYFEKVYPKLPQELGGVDPICVHLDLIQENLAPETRAMLIPSTDSLARVMRTKALDLYFKNEQLLVIKPQGSDRKFAALHLDADLVSNTRSCP